MLILSKWGKHGTSEQKDGKGGWGGGYGVNVQVTHFLEPCPESKHKWGHIRPQPTAVRHKALFECTITSHRKFEIICCITSRSWKKYLLDWRGKVSGSWHMEKQRRKLCSIDSATNRKWLMKICIVDSFHVTCGNTPSAERSLDGQSLKVLQRKLNCGVLWRLLMEIIWMLLEYLRWINLAFPCPKTKLDISL